MEEKIYNERKIKAKARKQTYKKGARRERKLQEEEDKGDK